VLFALARGGSRPDKLKLCTRRITWMAAMAETLSTSAAAFVAAVAGALLLSAAAAQRSPAPASEPGDPIAQNFLAEHEIGRRFHIDPADLPAPKAGPIVTNRSLIVPYDGQTLQVPQGFAATPFATGLVRVRLNLQPSATANAA
jgi:hypothetical protein